MADLEEEDEMLAVVAKRRKIIVAVVTSAAAMQIHDEATVVGDEFEEFETEEQRGIRLKRCKEWYLEKGSKLKAQAFQHEFRLHSVTFERLFQAVGAILVPPTRRPWVIDLKKGLLMLLVFLGFGSPQRRLLAFANGVLLQGM